MTPLLSIRYQSFPDVPENHWAAKAVPDLKDAGILVGYPSGDFKKGH